MTDPKHISEVVGETLTELTQQIAGNGVPVGALVNLGNYAFTVNINMHPDNGSHGTYTFDVSLLCIACLIADPDPNSPHILTTVTDGVSMHELVLLMVDHESTIHPAIGRKS